jgi:hypothetical protein
MSQFQDPVAQGAHERQAILQATREHLAQLYPGATITPADLQRVIHAGWNAACSALEALERDGELVRAPYGSGHHPGAGGLLCWTKAQPATPPGRGYALPLSSKEHGALLRALDHLCNELEPRPSAAPVDPHPDLKTLRAVRSKLKRPQ